MKTVFLALLGLVAVLADSVAAPAKPNIVFFLVDDMGWQETSVPFHSAVTEALTVEAIRAVHQAVADQRLSISTWRTTPSTRHGRRTTVSTSGTSMPASSRSMPHSPR